MNVNTVTKILPTQKLSIGIKLSENASMEYTKKSVEILKKQMNNLKKGQSPDKVFAVNCEDTIKVGKGVVSTFVKLSIWVGEINGQTLEYFKPKIMTDEVKLFFKTLQANIDSLGLSNSVIHDYIPKPEEIREDLEKKLKTNEKRRNDILIFLVFLLGIVLVIYGDNLEKFDLTKNIEIKNGKEIVTGIRTNVVQIIGVAMVGLGILKLGWAMFSRIIFRKREVGTSETSTT